MKKYFTLLLAAMMFLTAATAMAAGSLVVYSPHDADPLNAGVAMFQAAYPDIDVQVIAAGTGELCQRIVHLEALAALLWQCADERRDEGAWRRARSERRALGLC